MSPRTLLAVVRHGSFMDGVALFDCKVRDEADHCLHHPNGMGTDGVVKIYRLFFGDVLWKVCGQEHHVGPFVPENKSSLTMKEGLCEAVGPDLFDNCLQIGQQVVSISCTLLVS